MGLVLTPCRISIGASKEVLDRTPFFHLYRNFPSQRIRRRALSSHIRDWLPSRKEYSKPIKERVLSRSVAHTISQALTILVRYKEPERFKRRIVSFESNVTCSRKIDSFDYLDRLEDHVGRRVQLFYYLALAYYKEGLTVSMAHTEHQHGSSKIPLHSAAHSSILGNIQDNFLEHFFEKMFSRTLQEKDFVRMRQLGVSNEMLELLKRGGVELDYLKEYFKGVKTSSILSKETHFYHNLNSTIELPFEINRIDCEVERELRPLAIQLINESSSGVHPYICLEKFCGFFRESLQNIKEKWDRLFKSIPNPSLAHTLALQLSPVSQMQKYVVLPSYELLSGVLEHGIRRGLTEKELLLQKEEILSSPKITKE